MAMESVDNKVTSKKIEHEDGDEKANPTGRLPMIKGRHKTVSRYLSGHIASCHDLCKYGIKHDVEAKPWNSARKMPATRGRKTKVPEETAVSLIVNRKSTSSSASKASPTIGKPNSNVVIKEVISSPGNQEIIPSEKNIPPLDETDVPVDLEHTGIEIKQEQSEPPSLPVQDCSNGHGNNEKVKGKNLVGSNSRGKSESRNKQIGATLVVGKKTFVSPITTSPSKHYVRKSCSPSTKTATNLKGVSSQKNQKNVRNAKHKLASNDNLPEKILHIIEPTLEIKPVPEPTLACDNMTNSPLLSGDNSLNEADKQIGESGLPASTSKSTSHVGRRIHKTISAAPTSLSSVSKGKRAISPLKSPLKIPNVAISRYNKARQGHHQGENVKVGYKIRPGRSSIIVAGSKVIPARKLSFRRGKVIELQPQSNSIPKRLKFRPVRLLPYAQRKSRDNNDARKRIIRRKEVDDGESNDANTKPLKAVPRLSTVEGNTRRSFRRKVLDGSKLDESKSGSEKVVLRHQNKEGKKVTRSLYNNVIEETASKLAELRKSKVKALVGAFETVISLDSPREATFLETATAS